MEKRRIGSSDLEIAPLIVGGNVFGWTLDEQESFRILDEFVDRGANVIDTADNYSFWVPGNIGGESETIIGNWLKRSGKRHQVIVSSKCGGEGRRGLAPAVIREDVDASLRRLGVDCIDLYYAHRDDPGVPQEDVLSTFSGLIAEGKIRYIGASNFTADRLRSALQVSRDNGLASFVCLEPLYNLCERITFESELQSVCTEFGLGVTPYFGLASGFLTGKYRKAEDAAANLRSINYVAKYMNDNGFRILAGLDQISVETGATPAQISLAWLLSRRSVSAPIVSATKECQIIDLLGAIDLRLTPGQIEQLDAASTPL